MEIAALVLAALAIPVCAVSGFVMALQLRRRVDVLERRITILQAGAGETSAGTAMPPASEPAFAEAPPIPEAEPVPVAPEPEPAPPQGGPGLEERLGTRWAVWVGGLALGLGGVFLVRYSIEQGLLGPGARIAAGALFAAALLGAGEWLRRREAIPPLPGIASAHVPSVLVAAGTSTAFATTYAAYALYGLIGPAAAFVLLGAIAVLTMLAAALHGPALAALGLVAAFGSPLLVSSSDPQFWPLVVYLAVVTAAAYGLARLRLWQWLATAGAAGALGWGAMMLLSGTAGDMIPLMAHVVVQTALAAGFLIADPHRLTPDEDARTDFFSGGVMLVFALLTVAVTIPFETGGARPYFAGAVALGMVFAATRYAPAAPVALCGALAAAGTLLAWPVVSASLAETPLVLPGVFSERPAALRSYLAFGAITATLIAALSFLRIERGRALPLPLAGWYAAAGTLGPLAALAAAYWRVAGFDRSLPFAAAAGVLGLGFTAIAARLRDGAADAPAPMLGTGAAAAGAVAALAFGLTFALDKGMLTVAFALSALGTAWIGTRLDIPALRHVVGAIGLLVLGRLLYDPTIAGPELGRTPILNWLLWGYGVPAVAFWAAARLMERHGRDRMVMLAEGLAIVFAALLVFFQIRHLLQGGDPLAPVTNHLEAGLVATASLGFSLVMMRLDLGRSDPLYRYASLTFGAIALWIAVVGLALAENPLFSREPVPGRPVVNSLLAAYLLPGLLAGAIAAAARGRRPGWFVASAAAGAILLVSLYIGLEIRRLFQGPIIAIGRPAGQGEQWAYSLALLAIGLALLAFGLLRGHRLVRLVSAAYIIAAVLKVFIVDLSNLEGLMRALSFIGLGLVLVAIGLGYQKLLGSRAPQPESG